MHAWLSLAQISPELVAIIKSGGPSAVIVVLVIVVAKLHRDHAAAQEKLLAQATMHSEKLLAQAQTHRDEILRLRAEFEHRIDVLNGERIEELGTVTAALGTVTSLAATLTQAQSLSPTPIPPPPRKSR